MTQALAGIRVLDLTNVLAGPFCAYQLALLGAEVIKVEVPEQRRPRAPARRRRGAQRAAHGRVVPGAERRQEVGHGQPQVAKAARRCCGGSSRTADVLVENFRPGVMDRLGLGYEELRQHNPSLVYCAISGFGQDGPMKDAPAYDQIIQGLSGMMSITGDERCAPLRVGLSGRRHARRHHRRVRDRERAGAAACAPARARSSTSRCSTRRSRAWAGSSPTT